MRIKHAMSRQDGIVFYSNQLPGSNESPGAGVHVYYDEFGTLTSIRHIELPPEDNAREIKRLRIETIMLNLVLICLALISRNIYFISAAIFFGWLDKGSLVKILNCMIQFRKKDKRGFSIAKFHAVEHMVIKAYNRLGRVPTYEEIEKESIFSKTCGSRKFFSNILTAVSVSLYLVTIGIYETILTSSMLVFVLTIITGVIAVFFAMFCNKKNVSMYLEILLLSKPTSREIWLAQFGAKEFEEMEKTLKTQTGNTFQNT